MITENVRRQERAGTRQTDQEPTDDKRQVTGAEHRQQEADDFQQ